MKTIIKVFLALSLLIAAPTMSFAWGAQGHRLVVETALSMLAPQARQKVLTILGNYSPDLAAVWMDSVRIHHVPKYRYMNSWHFFNMEDGQTYNQAASNHDVVYNLQGVINFFNHIPPGVSRDSVRTNLKILFHLMGDITQPLHDGYGSDKGANNYAVTTTIFNIPQNNLHHVWDDVMIMDGHINLQKCLAYYHTLTPAQIKAVNLGNTQNWMMQARSYLPQVYACHPVKNVNTHISKAYLDSNVSIVQQQLVFASVRLAKVLQQAFGS